MNSNHNQIKLVEKFPPGGLKCLLLSSIFQVVCYLSSEPMSVNLTGELLQNS